MRVFCWPTRLIISSMPSDSNIIIYTSFPPGPLHQPFDDNHTRRTARKGRRAGSRSFLTSVWSGSFTWWIVTLPKSYWHSVNYLVAIRCVPDKQLFALRHYSCRLEVDFHAVLNGNHVRLLFLEGAADETHPVRGCHVRPINVKCNVLPIVNLTDRI